MANSTDGAHGPSARQTAGRALAPTRRSAAARARRASAAGARRLRRLRKVPWRHMRALAPASATVGRGVGRASTSGGGQQLGQLVEGVKIHYAHIIAAAEAAEQPEREAAPAAAGNAAGKRPAQPDGTPNKGGPRKTAVREGEGSSRDSLLFPPSQGQSAGPPRPPPSTLWWQRVKPMRGGGAGRAASYHSVSQ